MYLINNKPKTFGDLSAGEDFVYIIDPNSGKIVQSKVRGVRTLKTNGRAAVLELKIYKIVAFDSVTESKMESANKELNTKIDWTIRVLNGWVMGPVTLPQVGVPTMISSDRKFLETWMTKTGPKKKKIIY